MIAGLEAKMRGKFTFVVGAAVGYVLGSRAGRERYEQIRRGAKKLWGTTPVQKGVHVVRDAVDERADDLKVVARRVGSQLLNKLADQTAGKSGESTSKKTQATSGAESSTTAQTKTKKPATRAGTSAAKKKPAASSQKKTKQEPSS